jgi:hypothetical protein
MKQKEHASRLCEEKWHALEEQDVYEELQSGVDGLDEQEAGQRLAYYGPNTLPVKEPPTIWAILLHQVLNPLIFILLAAAVASVAIGEAADAVFILIVIVLEQRPGGLPGVSGRKERCQPAAPAENQGPGAARRQGDGYPGGSGGPGRHRNAGVGQQGAGRPAPCAGQQPRGG